MANTTSPTTSSDRSFDAAIDQLERIVDHLQKRQVSVDTLSEAVAKGVELIIHCRSRLHEAEIAVSEVIATLDEPDDDLTPF